jgi:hypothetical protein
MHPDRLIASLEHFCSVLPAVVRGTSDADARWKPAPPESAWSILEIVRHLGDEEVDDFRMRLDLTLRDPQLEWPPIAPEQWAKDRRYNEDELARAVERFVQERAFSLAWLKSLRNPDWNSTVAHPKLGSMRAGDLLTSWAAHDQLHLRQIAKRNWQLVRRDGGEFTADYAGAWSL